MELARKALDDTLSEVKCNKSGGGWVGQNGTVARSQAKPGNESEAVG